MFSHAFDQDLRVAKLVLNTAGGFTAAPSVMDRLRTASNAIAGGFRTESIGLKPVSQARGPEP